MYLGADFDPLGLTIRRIQYREWSFSDKRSTLAAYGIILVVSQSGFGTVLKEYRAIQIDPQGQANKWAKAFHGKSLKTVDTKDKELSRTLEQAVQFGIPVLMQEVGDIIDPSLDPVLLKQIIIENGRK